MKKAKVKDAMHELSKRDKYGPCLDARKILLALHGAGIEDSGEGLDIIERDNFLSYLESEENQEALDFLQSLHQENPEGFEEIVNIAKEALERVSDPFYGLEKEPEEAEL